MRRAIASGLSLLNTRDRRLLTVAVVVQMAFSLLDLLGVLLFGLVGALSVTTVQSQPAPPMVQNIADRIGLQQLSSQELVLAFAGVAAIVLIAKSALSFAWTRRILAFLANRQALISARLSKELLSRPLSFVQTRSSQEMSYALIQGCASAGLVLGQMVIAATELALLGVLGTALLVVSPAVALGSIAFFSLVALSLQWTTGHWAVRVGAVAARADIESLGAVQEALGTYREISVSNRRHLYVERIQSVRWSAARASADRTFIGMVPKYIFDAALVIGGFILAATLFATQDAVSAVGTLALFLAAGTRVMPSLLRLQGAAVGIRGAAASAEPTFRLAADLNHPVDLVEQPSNALRIRERIQRGNPDFIPMVSVRSITVTYPGSASPALADVSLEVSAGETVALVGPSGAGKSTLADAILGVVAPDFGAVLLNELPPGACIDRWPGALAYVPQHVVLSNDSVRSNVALGLPREAIDDELVWQALNKAHVADIFRSQSDGLDSLVGENGLRLSGGQRQRIGIARALYTRPRLLVLDEATSNLDAESEKLITETTRSLGGDVTTIVVAHRIATVRDFAKIAYLDHGKVLAVGSFREVATEVPAFKRQAMLMGVDTNL